MNDDRRRSELGRDSFDRGKDDQRKDTGRQQQDQRDKGATVSYDRPIPTKDKK